MACPNPYIRPIGACAATITLSLGLEAETEYMFIYQFKGGNKYAVGYTTDIDGDVVLTQNEDIEGFWSYGDELVTFQVFLGNACDPLIFNICDVEYDTLGFEFQGVTSTLPNIFTCECAEI
jgi:hypothetical protein